MASFNFDASISEIFTTLLSGATLNLFKKDEIDDFQLFEKKIEQNQISILTITPAYLRNIDISKLSNLKTLISAGENADKELLLKIRNEGVKVLNAYGPTETSICATIFELDEEYSEFENIPIQLNILFENIYSITLPKFANKEINYRYVYDENIPAFLEADAVRVNQILLNLISNAIKFTEKGKIEYSAQLMKIEDGYANIKISVSDTGIGIDKHIVNRLFKIFGTVNRG